MTHIFSGAERESFALAVGVTETATGSGLAYDPNYARGCLELNANSGGLLQSPDFSTSYATFWLHFKFTVTSSPGAASLVTTYDSTGTAVFRARVYPSSTWWIVMEYWTGSAWTAIGSAWSGLAGDTAYTVDLKVVGGASLAAELYLNSSLISSGTASTTAVTGTKKFQLYCAATSNQVMRVSEIIARDTTTLGMRLESETATANGTDVDGVGGFGDIDELSTTDTDLKNLPSSGNRASFTSPARTQGTTGQKVYAVTATARAFSDSNQSIKFYLLISGTRYYSPAIALTGVITGYQYSWEVNPATGSTWTMAAAQAANLEWGYEVV